MNKRIYALFTLIKVVCDATVIYFSFLFAYWVRFTSGIMAAPKGVPSVDIYTRVLPVVVLIFLGACKWAGLYEVHPVVHSEDDFINVFKGVFVATIFTISATFLYREYSYSRLVLVFAFFINLFALYLFRCLLRVLRVRFFTPFSRDAGVLIIGEAKAKESLERNLLRHGDFDVYFTPEIDIEEISGIVENNRVEEIVMTDPAAPKKKILELISFCEDNDIEFKMVPDMIELKMGEMNIDSYFGVPVLKLKHPLFEPSNYYFKRSYDILFSFIFLVLAAPFLILVSLLIYIDNPGPVFYYHRRRGYRGRDFNFYKFRSMVIDADKKLKSLMKHNERGEQAFKIRKDPRITRVGRFIRNFSIDEIPQLFNVLKGDMSLVGPRPQVLWEAEGYDEEAKRRLSILPGITGLWQVSGRSDLSYREMIRLDLYYLENWTPGFDIKILLKTLPVVLLRKGAC